MTTKHFTLDKLSCPSCVMHLEAMEDDVAGVKKVNANFKKHHMTVQYDEQTQTVDGIVEAVAAMGYVAVPLENNDNEGMKGFGWNKLFRS